MHQILFIYTDSRLNGIMAQLRHDVRGLITVAGDFDEGLRLVFEKRPSVIFVQYEISGVSCIAVVTHVKNLLRDSAPRIIALLPAASQRILVGRDLFEGVVTISDERQTLLAHIENELRTLDGFRFLEGGQQDALHGSPSSDDVPLEISPLGEGETFSLSEESVPPPVVTDESDASSARLFLEPAASLPDEPVIFDVPPRSAEETPAVAVGGSVVPDRGNGLSPPLPTEKPDAEETREFFAIHHEEATELPPYDQLFSLRRKSSPPLLRRTLMLLLPVLVLIALAAAYHLMGGGGTRAPVADRSSSPPVPEAGGNPPRSEVLPPFAAQIPVDLTATVQRPGWEVRRSSRIEIRSQLERNKVKALQLISLVPEGIPGDILAQLWEFAGGGFSDGERTMLGEGIIMLLRRNGAGVEAVVYRQDTVPDPVGVVLVFP